MKITINPNQLIQLLLSIEILLINYIFTPPSFTPPHVCSFTIYFNNFKRSIGSVRTTIIGTGTTTIPKQYQLFNFNNLITNFKSSSSRSSYGGSSNYSNYSSSNNSNNTLKILFASTGSSFLLLSTFARKIHNDTGSLTQYQQQQQQPSLDLSISKQQPLQKQYHESRFSNYLNYEELTIGSVVGLFLGVIIGKLSQVIVFVSLLSYF